MARDKILTVLAMLWLYFCGGLAQTDSSVPCDDRRVEKVVNLTLGTHNKMITEGAQLALYEILEATKAQNESGDVLLVRFSSRETDCPAGGEKTWHECDYLQQADKALRICHAKVQFTEAGEELLLHDCLEPAIIASVAPCLGCPENIDVHKEELRQPLIHSLSKANSMINHVHFFIFKDLTSATKQVVAGFRYKLQFEIEKSNCTRPEFKIVTEECHPLLEKTEVLKCNSSVDVAPWRHEVPEVHVVCEAGVSKTNSRFKRPPGWSPLRMLPQAKESSEESKESISPPKHVPLNCPTKPWKEFKPIIAPPNATEPSEPSADTALSDLDLIR
ncbi:kininogen-1 precursor [Danio rerio]|uniref:Kininogen 1 n=1 Tax=Danio rerio TaxID=7955 RepID=Q5XJ76_DANRE|nr:kininogen-1 precursor [Danio rerio]AAH83429.1 Kininogen 1 [Danio rerio]AAI63998.1 Kng1 protein [Danio rerio]|eukprot:NP_001005981.1 kininogen-1 precursor [Danio rerio]